MRGLFIGIGGTGDEILARLKEKVVASVGEIPESLQFRLIDTLDEDGREQKGARLGEDGTEIAIKKDEYLQLKDDPPGNLYKKSVEYAGNPQDSLEISRWYQSDTFVENLVKADFGLVVGAGQHRQIARMGAFFNRIRLMNMLKKAMESYSGGSAELPIWIIGSIAGGTGAGIFMDIALLARHLEKENNVHTRIIGAAILPDVFTNIDGIDLARSHAVMRELQRFQSSVKGNYTGRLSSTNVMGVRFSVEYASNLQVHLNSKLYDNLVFYSRRCEDKNARNGFFSEIADGLNLLLDEAISDRIYQNWINSKEGHVSSFSTHRIFIPIALYQRQFVLEAALDVASGLLPRDAATQALIVGSKDDRKEDARKIIDEEFPRFFQKLNKLASKGDFEKLTTEMTAFNIVDRMLGFANPVSVFGDEIGSSLKEAAKRLYMNIFEKEFDDADEGVKTIRDFKEDFNDSKERIQREVASRQNEYKGDGKRSFNTSLSAIRDLVEKLVKDSIDKSVQQYLSKQSSSMFDQALGRTNYVCIQIRDSMRDIRNNLDEIIGNDRRDLGDAKGQEEDALVELKELTKSFLGGKGKLADIEERYINAATAVNQCLQREKLVAFLREMIDLAEERMQYWLNGMQGWQKAIGIVAQDASTELNEIRQRLDRLTKDKSASMGLKNTVDMDGYRGVLREKCLMDEQTGESFVKGLLNALNWKPSGNPQDLQLDGGSVIGSYNPGDFPHSLSEFLEKRIAERVSTFEGMASYLQWLRDVKGDNPVGLADRLATVNTLITGYQAPNNSILVLHGEDWVPSNGNDEFNTIYNAIAGRDAYAEAQHNLRDMQGVNLFKDKNVLAVLLADNMIPYSEIGVLQDMQDQYFKVRNSNNPSWRARTYHVFRCDREAWEIERAQSVATRNTDFPEIPGNLSRLLDEPGRVKLFVKSLISGVIRKHSSGIDGSVWVCGACHQEDENRLVYLNDPDDDKDPGDLLRALVTFVMDKNDRRRQRVGSLDSREIKGWIKNCLIKENKTLENVAIEYRDSHSEQFNIVLSEMDNTPSIGKETFLALILGHYLEPYLQDKD